MAQCDSGCASSESLCAGESDAPNLALPLRFARFAARVIGQSHGDLQWPHEPCLACPAAVHVWHAVQRAAGHRRLQIGAST